MMYIMYIAWAPARIALSWLADRPELEALVDQIAGGVAVARARR
ncbi:transcriptional regulator [Mycolicibacterium canariasense]|uniref:Transcriptional regulator n=1 Tax=Mycolicibacterium canariasense TaxID=228230 RepID=A0A100W7J6_MYCCR|nr:transcriptional regulator [Mycolicibacterium canariasense]